MNTADTVLVIGKNSREVNASREVRSIREALANVSSHVRVFAPDDPRPQDIVASLREQNPTVLHLISHGYVDADTGEPYFEVADEHGNPVDMSLAKLRDHLRKRSEDPSTKRLKCIVLNACHIGLWAHHLGQVADVVIGADNKLAESMAQRFAEIFYKQLASACSVQAAFDDACATLRFEEHASVDRLAVVQAYSETAANTFIGRTEAKSAAQPAHDPTALAHDAFVIYCADDAFLVSRMASRLRELGVTTFTDSIQHQLSVPGVNWVLEAERAISRSKCGVVVLSKSSMSVPAVREQYSSLLVHCWNNAKRIIPLLLDDVDVPEFLGPRGRVDFRGKTTHDAYMEELERLKIGILGQSYDKPPLGTDAVYP